MGLPHTPRLCAEEQCPSRGILAPDTQSDAEQGSLGCSFEPRKLTFMDLYGLRTVLFAKAWAWHRCDFGLVPGPGNVQRFFEPSNRLDVPAASIPGGEALLSWSAPVV